VPTLAVGAFFFCGFVLMTPLIQARSCLSFLTGPANFILCFNPPATLRREDRVLDSEIHVVFR
jgi:hypothetical protein